MNYIGTINDGMGDQTIKYGSEAMSEGYGATIAISPVIAGKYCHIGYWWITNARHEMYEPTFFDDMGLADKSFPFDGGTSVSSGNTFTITSKGMQAQTYTFYFYYYVDDDPIVTDGNYILGSISFNTIVPGEWETVAWTGQINYVSIVINAYENIRHSVISFSCSGSTGYYDETIGKTCIMKADLERSYIKFEGRLQSGISAVLIPFSQCENAYFDSGNSFYGTLILSSAVGGNLNYNDVGPGAYTFTVNVEYEGFLNEVTYSNSFFNEFVFPTLIRNGKFDIQALYWNCYNELLFDYTNLYNTHVEPNDTISVEILNEPRYAVISAGIKPRQYFNKEISSFYGARNPKASTDIQAYDFFEDLANGLNHFFYNQYGSNFNYVAPTYNA